MTMTTQTTIAPPAPLVHSGKVRDTYDLGSGRLLMVASDRISAFDVILPTAIPGKGEVLTQLSLFWFARTSPIIRNHLTGETVNDLNWSGELTEYLAARSMIVHRAERISVECVVRGYLAGSGWTEYQATGQVAGHALPDGLQKSGRLPQPIFTPARKNDSGHDENITLEQLRSVLGRELAERLESVSLAIYELAASLAANTGVLIADTKFEFGFIRGELALIDEILTPDSSRFWDASIWRQGDEPASWDKQFVRNWLIDSGWDQEPPAPELPPRVVSGTQRRYREAFERITGRTLNEWLGRADEEAAS